MTSSRGNWIRFAWLICTPLPSRFLSDCQQENATFALPACARRDIDRFGNIRQTGELAQPSYGTRVPPLDPRLFRRNRPTRSKGDHSHNLLCVFATHDRQHSVVLSQTLEDDVRVVI